jgi:uncharacterized protein (DUF2252 family)
MTAPADSPTTPDECLAAGKAARARAPRSAHAEWGPAADRRDPVELLEQQATSRVGQLVPLRYARMLASPFAFYRGAAAVMAADLGGAPCSGFEVQLCGDAHLSNFGAFASPDRELLFDVNDFDETLPGPWEWDVMRLAASFSVAGRERGFGDDQRRRIVAAMAAEYRGTMRRLAELGNLEVWYTKMDVPIIAERWGKAAGPKEVKAFQRSVAKAQAKDRMRALSKLTHEVDGELRIVSEPPLIVPIEELVDGVEGADQEAIETQVLSVLADYRDTLPEDRRVLLDSYRPVHVALKVVGVGSVGTRAWIALLLGRDKGDPLFLQIKEAQRSVLEPYASPSAYVNQGERVVQGQRLMQAASDIMLGWVRTTGIDDQQRDFYVRQLWDQKGSVRIDRMDPGALTAYAQICGMTLAHSHARSGDRIAIAAYLGKGSTFDDSLASFAETYADLNERDYEALRAAADEGRIEVAEAAA